MNNYRIAVVVLCALTLAGIGFGQGAAKQEAKHAVNHDTLQELTAVEKSLWDAWKNNNVEAFQAVLRNDVVAVSHAGVSGKAEVISRLSSKGCALTDYSLEDFRLVMIDKTSALLTFKGAYTCAGQQRRSGFFATIFTSGTGKSTSSSANSISGKWMNVFCQETSALQ